MFVAIIKYPPIKEGKDAEFRAWFKASSEEFLKQPGFIRRQLLVPRKGGLYVAIVEHESVDTFTALHRTEAHAQARQRADAFFDGDPSPTFYDIVAG